MPVPTLIVRGADDPIAPQRWCEELTQLLPHGYLAVIPAAPHAVNYDAPSELAQVVLAFLGEPSATSAKHLARRLAKSLSI